MGPDDTNKENAPLLVVLLTAKTASLALLFAASLYGGWLLMMHQYPLAFSALGAAAAFILSYILILSGSAHIFPRFLIPIAGLVGLTLFRDGLPEDRVIALWLFPFSIVTGLLFTSKERKFTYFLFATEVLFALYYEIGPVGVIMKPTTLPPVLNALTAPLSLIVSAILAWRSRDSALKSLHQLDIAAKDLSDTATRLKVSEQIFRGIFNFSPVGIIQLDRNLTISSVNKAFADLVGYSESELLNKSSLELKFPEDRTDSLVHSKNIPNGQSLTFEKRYLHKTGKPVWAQVTVRRVEEENGNYAFLGVTQDITERKRQEVLRNLSHKIDQLLIENNTVGGTDELPKKIIETVCDYMTWEYGQYWIPNRVTGVLEPSSIVVRDSAFQKFAQVSEKYSFLPGIGLPGRTLVTKRPSFVENLGTDSNFPRRDLAPSVPLGSGCAFPILLEGQALGVVEFISKNKIDFDDSLERFFDSVSVRVAQMFLRSTERAKSIHNSKLASLGEMSAGMAHEINNPLAIIVGNLALLKTIKSDETKLDLKIETMKKAAHRIEKIVNGLRKFSRRTDGPDQKLESLSEIISESLIFVEAKSKRNTTTVTADISPDIKVLCNATEVEQVLVNLMNNALDAVKDRDEKWVKIKAFENEYAVIVQVSDSGVGITKEVEAKLFQPFFTTKPVGEGTGLGLSISRGILESHGATLTLNHDSRSTCFEIKFPKSEVLKQAA